MTRLPLEDIKILDFGWVLAGPIGARFLADLGAQVIKIESKAKVDGMRAMLPRNGVVDTLEEGGCAFQEFNRNKMGLCLNIKAPKGREIFEKLLVIADVVSSNYDPIGFRKLGLEWENLKKLNPGIIVINASGMGDSGPYYNFMSMGPNLQAIAGMTDIVGYPRVAPVGTGIAYADYLGGITLATAILAALEYRRKTGEGQFIDLSQCEAVMSSIGTSLLDWAANGELRTRHGNHHPSDSTAPHNCYRCKGEDRWCVIAVSSEEEWKAFCNILDNPKWTAEPKFSTHLNRIRYQEELDELIEAWTINHSAEEVTDRMQQVGISAGVVQNIEDIIKHDSHLRERNGIVNLEFPPSEREPSSLVIEGIVTKLSGVTQVMRPAPSLGQDNDRILKEILGMTQEEIDQAAIAGAFE